MRLSTTGLMGLLHTNVAELIFRRRIVKPGYSAYRRMLCTNDPILLNSIGGKNILNYDPPHGGHLKYSPFAKNLVICWDLFMQDYRAVNCNDCDVVSVIQSTPPEKFWNYFNENIIKMSAGEKMAFQNN